MKLLFFFLGINITITTLAQSKKDQIERLNTSIDSLNYLIGEERNLNAINQKNNENLILNYRNEIESKNKEINSLNIQMKIIQTQKDSIVKIYNKEIDRLMDSINNILSAKSDLFMLPYQHKKVINPNENSELTTVFLDFKNKYYIITDSIATKINDSEYCLFFLTPYENLDFIECPNEYGLIIIDKQSNEVFKSFWRDESNSVLIGNCEPGLQQFQTTNGVRTLMWLGSSACGSGRTDFVFEVWINKDNIFQFKLLPTMTTDSYSDIQYITEKNQYLKIERINPECHYSCPSKYRISTYSLSTDELIKSIQTKYSYDDFNDFDVDNILNQIKRKESNVFLN
jgi:hypothetical protein